MISRIWKFNYWKILKNLWM